MKNLGIYIHIPYCMSKCPYCDFYSVTDRSSQDRYINALLLHMEDYSQYARGYDVDTVFIGGGTPTCLPPKQITRLIDGIYDHFSVASDAEITVEMNPATAKRSALKSFVSAGINRLSIGMQSTDNDELKALGRIHTYEDFLSAYDDARRAGFGNINVDIMYATPNQTKESLDKTLSEVVSLSPEHISLYGLQIEDGTPFAQKKKELVLPGEDDEYDMYIKSCNFLEMSGYGQYEISNFSKPGKRCLHNLRYWKCEEYLGFGAGAHSYFRDHRFAYKKDIPAYISAMEYPTKDADILSENYEIGPSERLGEYVMLRLRLTEGLDTDEFAEKFGLSFERMFGKYLKVYVAGGFMEHTAGCYRFTRKGMFVSNYILSAMLDFDSDMIKGDADGSDR